MCRRSDPCASVRPSRRSCRSSRRHAPKCASRGGHTHCSHTKVPFCLRRPCWSCSWTPRRKTSGSYQRNRAVLLLVVEEERPVRKPADKVIVPVLFDNPVLSHVDIIPKTRLLYCPFIPGEVFEYSLLACAVILHLVSCDRVPNAADVRICFLFGNFAAWHTTQSPWNQAYTVLKLI